MYILYFIYFILMVLHVIAYSVSTIILELFPWLDIVPEFYKVDPDGLMAAFTKGGGFGLLFYWICFRFRKSASSKPVKRRVSKTSSQACAQSNISETVFDDRLSHMEDDVHALSDDGPSVIDDESRVNPATGLMMVGGIDTDGNPEGSSLLSDSGLGIDDGITSDCFTSCFDDDWSTSCFDDGCGISDDWA